MAVSVDSCQHLLTLDTAEQVMRTIISRPPLCWWHQSQKQFVQLIIRTSVISDHLLDAAAHVQEILSCNLSRSLSSSWDRRGDSEADRARSSRARTSVGEDGDPVLGRDWNEGSRRLLEDFTFTEKACTRAFSWLKAPTSAFTFKTLLRHYAKQALTPRSLNVKLGPRRNYHK